LKGHALDQIEGIFVSENNSDVTVLDLEQAPSDETAIADCECGCGDPAPIAKRTNKSRGQICGRPVRFIKGHSLRGVINPGKPPNPVVHLPNGTSVIEITYKGHMLECIVDTDCYPLVSGYRWRAFKSRNGRTFYAMTNLKTKDGGNEMFMHRLLLPGAEEVDHRNHDGLCNTKENLRPCTHLQNCANQRKKRSASSSIYKGVSWDKRYKKFVASIYREGKQMYIGSFIKEEDAARARDAAALQHDGEFAILNFPRVAKAA
jgi:hypothetical protein